MKKHTFIAAAAAALMAAAPATHTFAKKFNVVQNTNIAARQIDSNDEYIYLQVTLWQNDEKAADFRVTDTQGEVLFADRFKTRTHTVTLKFLASELNAINIEMANADGQYRKQYEVETTTTYSTGVKEVSTLK